MWFITYVNWWYKNATRAKRLVGANGKRVPEGHLTLHEGVYII
jgi:hypothetical protein